ncbi:MAG TPA: HNH endonuclease [Fimbriimonadaceae bacterium]|nr:HNH endonuclease [Fimbriimonadaceae bacterium]
MAVRRIRCSVCRQYILHEEAFRRSLGSVCSSECLNELYARRRARHGKRGAKLKARKSPKSDWQAVRSEILKRDGHACRWCGRTGDWLEVHHIAYRSEGGPDEAANLITLCDEHHEIVHSNKRLYKPVLRATVWMTYLNGLVSVPQVMAWLERQPWYERPLARVG